MPQLSFKILESADDALQHLELLQQLSPKLTRETAHERLTEMYAMGNYKLMTAWLNNTCIGLCGFWLATKLYSGKYIELDNVVVHKDYRNQQIGEQLCSYVIEIAKTKGCKMAMLDAYLENNAGHRFYNRLGFYLRGFHFLKQL